jgi:hypothetical protein
MAATRKMPSVGMALGATQGYENPQRPITNLIANRAQDTI